MHSNVLLCAICCYRAVADRGDDLTKSLCADVACRVYSLDARLGALVGDYTPSSLTGHGHSLGSLALPPAALPSLPITPASVMSDSIVQQDLTMASHVSIHYLPGNSKKNFTTNI